MAAIQEPLVTRDAAGLEKIILKEPLGASAEVYLYGGQVVSWKNDRGEELLFLSSKTSFKPPKPIRGGIPICFPQFANVGALEKHGFARNRLWSIETDAPPILSSTNASGSNSSRGSTVDLILKPAEDDLKMWTHKYVENIFFHCCEFYMFLSFSSFELRMRLTLKRGGDLAQTIRVRNTDTKPFTFTFALHTYFSVSDISEVRIEGLETLDFLDNLQDRERFTEQGDSITFDGEVDRVYVSTPTKIAIVDHEKKRTIVVKKEGLPDAVVWNPWDKKAKAMADFGDDEYLHMVCVEPAVIETPITLKPGEEWKGRQEISVVPSSYCSGQLDPGQVVRG
ncbi:putative glucose-6-phosphate 1-epimerase isoform X1 [Selaginella moellendorffii]|uniref:putative glucose-6-phosphate 1-epimerase isoform X1 n=1 Tax=Selaginella moellendorffii TaxID=88036 RepID=UPI000D1C6200|nr:putative glucose-6-phosphate 1-epimerase isoform X1 [Selaginella moellendorffii]|eukprot:XP_024517192.1 putative glucose-6-phosphate 1-epimerase isoform X1 [Selaginella moellendorffii]